MRDTCNQEQTKANNGEDVGSQILGIQIILEVYLLMMKNKHRALGIEMRFGSSCNRYG